MKLYLSGHEDRYALEQLQLCLFPDEPMEYVDQPFRGDGAVSCLHSGKVYLTATARITRNGITASASKRLPLAKETYALRRRILQQSYYLAAVQLLERRPPWGALSGVRPTKLTSRRLLAGDSLEQAARWMEEHFFVTPERSRLCAEASLATVQTVSKLSADDVSVYIGIPFCPTRCAYCSFVSQTAGRAGKLLVPYLDCLKREIEHTGRLLKQSGKTVRTLYIGGGTPTTLSTEQMKRLMGAINTHFDLGRLIEYTVEGGRPDTLDPEKLKAIRDLGATRVSINPQTMNDEVLKAVGRRHTAAQTVEAYRQAVAVGFESINMDLIAGLPGETPESFADSLSRVIDLHPSNITVHTLALKKGADLFESRDGLKTAEEMARMVDFAGQTLRREGYRPYYLYRQKYMSGSFENVGWCKDGDIGLYNICMMEELHSIISLGGGAMSKVNLSETKLTRFHNPKFPKEYTERIEDVLAQKDALFRVLSRLNEESPQED